jgi:outer membrane protein assembly factor BamC
MMTIFPSFARRAAVLCLALGAMQLSGCAISDYIEDKGKIDYKSSSTNRRPTLEVPPDLVSPRSDERFNLPSRSGERTLSSFERDRTGATGSVQSGVLPSPTGIRIERAGQQRWISVDAPPERVWPQVRDFWVETGFKLEIDNAATGTLETNWQENRARIPQDFIRSTIGRVIDGAFSSGTMDKFRTRVERTPEGRTEIYVSHRGLEEVSNTTRDRFLWQSRAPEPDLEVEMMNRLVLKLAGGRAEQLRAAAAGATAGSAAPDVRAVGQGAERALEIADPFDRAWRRLGLALDRGGFTVEDRDRSKGAYFVRYIDSDEQARAEAAKKPGFFARMFSSSSKPELSQQYRLVLASAGQGSRLTIQDKDGKPTPEADRATVNRILDLLLQQMVQ